MKTPFVFIFSLAAATAAYSQGQGDININNCDPTHPPAQPISYAAGGPQAAGKIDGSGTNPQGGYDFAGTNALAGMYGGPLGCSADQMVLLVPAVSFRSGIRAGCVNCGSSCYRSVPGIPPGQWATIQMRAWDAGISGVDSYEHAAAIALSRGVYLGTSEVANVQIGSGPYPGAEPLYALVSFSISWTAATGPVITNQPRSQTVAAGTNVTFSVGASGTAPLYYQWWFAGATLPGQTNATLSISNVQAANLGAYWVVVSNSVGTATSEQATLSIIPQLEIFSVPAILVKGAVGFNYLLEYANEAGPTNAWNSLATITLTNDSQFYFDTSAIGQPTRCYRALQAP